MLQQIWAGENRKTTVCIDAYSNGELKGRFYNAVQEMVLFDNLTQFLLKMEAMLDEQQTPQSYTAIRRFSEDDVPDRTGNYSGIIRNGEKATFQVQVLFRQHTSWQGIVSWKERQLQLPFRSVLELVLLMDNALATQRE